MSILHGKRVADKDDENLIHYLHQRGNVFMHIRLFVCLSVNKITEKVVYKILGGYPL